MNTDQRRGTRAWLLAAALLAGCGGGEPADVVQVEIVAVHEPKLWTETQGTSTTVEFPDGTRKVLPGMLGKVGDKFTMEK